MEAGSAPRVTTLPAPGEPTLAGPGTETKIQTMIARAGRREALFHPLDGLRNVPFAALPQTTEAPERRLESA
jgi:hypothetical protein